MGASSFSHDNKPNDIGILSLLFSRCSKGVYLPRFHSWLELECEPGLSASRVKFLALWTLLTLKIGSRVITAVDCTKFVILLKFNNLSCLFVNHIKEHCYPVLSFPIPLKWYHLALEPCPTSVFCSEGRASLLFFHLLSRWFWVSVVLQLCIAFKYWKLIIICCNYLWKKLLFYCITQRVHEYWFCFTKLW